ncbi:MAG: quinolinate synthase NadA [Planctomycetes bacterium]|nr:quinolinate synthase NadA [Planctomycetota bacterium]
MSVDELDERIRACKSALGERVVILGHHYQQDDVIRYADFAGDSLRLSRLAGEQTGAEFIVFCGVHFMAESADILTSDSQTVILPDLSAGCSMADMADAADVQTCLDELSALIDGVGTIVPVTYVNSTAAVKAVTGRNGGACCTSGNCRAVLAWALRSGDQDGAGHAKVLAVPDQHLVRATALDMGYSLADCVVYRPHLPNGGLTADQVRLATFVLWDGCCSVHQEFTVEHVTQRRREYPGIRVIVHPECEISVVQAADMHGSTEQIIRTISDAPPASKWAVGTEINLVNRLACKHTDKLVVNLSSHQCLCTTMYRIDPQHLCWVLENLRAGRIVNRITVDPAVKCDARIALDRMVGHKGAVTATSTAK